jgi:hypothetical protein
LRERHAAPAVTTTGDLNTGIYFPAADNIGFATGGTIRGRWTDDGLCFGSDTAAADALDDYEEGTFTPIVTASSSAPSVSYATNGQRGYYTKIGRIVYFQAFFGINTIAGGSGNLLCGDLPFNPAGDLSVLRTWGNIVVGTSGVDWGASNTALAGYARGGTNTALVLALQNNVGWAGIPVGNVANGDEMIWSGWYQV